MQGKDGRWRTGPCTTKARACHGATGWFVGQGACPGGSWSVPRYGWEQVQLAAAMRRAGVTEVVLALRLKAGRWTPLDAR